MKKFFVIFIILSMLFFVGCDEPADDVVVDDPDTDPDPEEVVDEGPVKIGFFAPLTGPVAADGESVLYAAQIAVETINNEGGINGRSVELIHYDDHLDSSEAVGIAQRLISSDNVHAVVSGSYSAPTRASAEVYQREGIPMIAAYAVHPDIPATGNFIFQQTFLGSVQGRAGAYIAMEELDAEKVAILYVDNDFGHTLADAFKEYIEDHGGAVVFDDSFTLGEEEFTPSLTRINELDADLLYFPAYPSEGAQIIRQSNDIGLDIAMLGTQGVDSSQFLDIVGMDADGLIITTNFNRDDERPVVQNFISDYYEIAGYPPDMISVSTFDSFLLLREVMEEFVTEPDSIAEGILALEDFEALSGTASHYTEIGEVRKPVQVQVVQNGEFRYYDEVDNPDIINP